MIFDVSYMATVLLTHIRDSKRMFTTRAAAGSRSSNISWLSLTVPKHVPSIDSCREICNVGPRSLKHKEYLFRDREVSLKASVLLWILLIRFSFSGVRGTDKVNSR